MWYNSGPECFVPNRTLNVLSVFWQFLTEVYSVKVSKSNQQGVTVFIHHVDYLIKQVL